jgi:predicted nucleic acid-binding protein
MDTVSLHLRPIEPPSFLQEKLRLLPDSLVVHEEWRRLLVAYGVSGVRVHDARLVAAMRVHEIKHILTFNDKDFSRYTGIEAVNPRGVSLA